MDIIKLTKLTHSEALQKAAAVLKLGGLVIYPTETCYGIGADATNQTAIDALLRYKTKRKDKPISVAVTGEEMAGRYVHINNVARNMYQHFLPGPITVVSKGKGKLAAGVESSMGTQGIRVPNHPFILDLVKKYKKPITATSANASYKKTPYTINDVLDNISAKQKKLVSLIIDAGRLPKRKPSTVVDTTLDNIQIVRAGSIKLQNPKTYIANSLDDTKQFVEKLHTALKKNWGNKTIVFLLQGDLGAGKTHFTKFLAEKLSVKELVTSPTFTLCNEYHGKNNGKKIIMYHMDTYRMYSPEEVDNLKPEKMFESPHVVVVEWANKIHDYIKPYLKKAIVVQILINAPEETKRVFEYTITR